MTGNIRFRFFLAIWLVVLSMLVPAGIFSASQVIAGSLVDPIAFSSLPDGRILVVEKSGIVLQVQNGVSKPWADLSSTTFSEKDAGLLGIAVHPQFASNGYVFLSQSYQEGNSVYLRLLRMRDTGTNGVVNRVLIDNLVSGTENPGGITEIGPDGCIYLGIGDGGESKLASPQTLRGVLLRLNLDGKIPDDNPTPQSPLWAWGFRDPRGLAWTPSGVLYEVDRGPAIVRGTMDSLNLVEKNKNYGWPKYMARDWAPNVERPVIYCSSGHSWVPGGMAFIVSGKWNNSLVFAGRGEGNLYRLSLDVHHPSKITFYEELYNGDLGELVDVHQTSEGQILLLSRTNLYKIEP